jgi:hypothetical protein
MGLHFRFRYTPTIFKEARTWRTPQVDVPRPWPIVLEEVRVVTLNLDRP